MCSDRSLIVYLPPLRIRTRAAGFKIISGDHYTTNAHKVFWPTLKPKGACWPPAPDIFVDIYRCYVCLSCLQDIVDCDIDPLHYLKFAPTSSVTRGHNIRLIKPICNTNCQLYFFTNRVVTYWNSLPADIVNASSFGIFVRKLDSHDLSGFCRGGRA